tara:strand:+ start:178045 stop:178335 length:291 start_codon:yes stop_codon:yes gene_type:complete
MELDYVLLGSMALVYVVGFIISLLILSWYGEQLGFGGYDEEKTYVTQDDYSSNASAFLAFSTIWPIFLLVNSLVYFHGILTNQTQKLINYYKDDSI